ncbi:DUF4349 domain-containing protein [Candidatus Woesearchaeota archaeon]|nr:DUF4349 domain-containing protein [Candidatus Woesearchaeota archaeon]
MSISSQLSRLKENWLIIVLVLLVLSFSNCSGLSSPLGLGNGFSPQRAAYDYAESAIASERYIAPTPSSGFAPEVEVRKIIKTASLSSEVKKGAFTSAESQLKNIIQSSDSFLLDQSVRELGEPRSKYKSGSYNIKVDTEKYNSVISQLRQIGEITYFSETDTDVTARVENLDDRLEAERSRLQRYQSMFDTASRVEDQITLNDRIFEQERTIKYLEESLRNIGQQIDYSSISFTLTERQSDYASIAFVKLSQLVKNFVGSVNSLLTLFVVVVPYAFAAAIAWFGYNLVRRKKKQS